MLGHRGRSRTQGLLGDAGAGGCWDMGAGEVFINGNPGPMWVAREIRVEAGGPKHTQNFEGPTQIQT